MIRIRILTFMKFQFRSKSTIDPPLIIGPISDNVCGHTDVFKSLSPTGERKPKFHFGASPGGSAKTFENVVEQLRQYIRS